MKIDYPEIGVCGLSCQLCPRYHTNGSSRCGGCKSEYRMGAGCPFITCAVKKRGLEFCWECGESTACLKWEKHRAAGRQADSFKCYQKLSEDIIFIRQNGVTEYKQQQDERQAILREMLTDYGDRRSKSYYCVAATVLAIEELRDALTAAAKSAAGRDRKSRAQCLRSCLDGIAARRGYFLGLRKRGKENK